ncbi:hypothetical protein [Stutzerimonas nitrititolerans]|uniref:hypothetical protein n=1 Tax=Stutzerimonas nitrititolerans TaxID=2482751 RepID=UPI0028ADB54D|nr:hypothetical protein [Stutzerimonas nitrititolerans]
MKTVLIDTNLLLVLVVGWFDPKLLTAHKNTCMYRIEDFELLCLYIEGYDKIVVTPNTLTEVSNLISQIGRPYKTSLRAFLGEFCEKTLECYVPSSSVGKLPQMVSLGLTDAAILGVDIPIDLFLTADLDLYLAGLERGLPIENFTHIRFPS